MTAVAIDASRAANPALGGPVPARTGGPATADRSPAVARPGRAIRSWLPRPRLRCSPGGSASRRRPASAWSPRCRASGPRCTWTTAITLPVGVETYAAYALRAWLARDQMLPDAQDKRGGVTADEHRVRAFRAFRRVVCSGCRRVAHGGGARGAGIAWMSLACAAGPGEGMGMPGRDLAVSCRVPARGRRRCRRGRGGRRGPPRRRMVAVKCGAG